VGGVDVHHLQCVMDDNELSDLLEMCDWVLKNYSTRGERNVASSVHTPIRVAQMLRETIEPVVLPYRKRAIEAQEEMTL